MSFSTRIHTILLPQNLPPGVFRFGIDHYIAHRLPSPMLRLKIHKDQTRSRKFALMAFITRLLALMPYHLYIVLLGLACYVNTLNNGFVFDDSAYLTSALVRNPDIGELLRSNWLGLDIYRPLTLLSLGLDFSLYQETPRGYHLSNLVLPRVTRPRARPRARPRPRAAPACEIDS